MKQLTSYEGLQCANCGAPMQGEFCHKCGQSIHSVLKPVHGMIEETVETVLDIDGRIVHTLPPLLLKPGFLTLEYFAGRRIRYIAPFRLMFVLSLLSFFLFHLAVDKISDKVANGHSLITVDSAAIDDATTPTRVRKALQEELEAIQTARALGAMPQIARDQTDATVSELRQKARERLFTLGAAPLPAASLDAPAEPSDVGLGQTVQRAVRLDSSPVHFSWLPAVANEHLTELAHRFQDNWRTFVNGDAKSSAQAKQRMISGIFSTLPATMFVLIPVFAMLIKLFYVFRRRLYMEHLIVALHSHAFIFLSLLLITLTGMASTWLRPHAAWTGYALGWVQALLMLWVPIYLLTMQKRVYRQRWPMTLLKFWCIGWCYFWLLTLALMIAAALGMAY